MKGLMLTGALLLLAFPALSASAPAATVRRLDAQEEYEALNKEYRAASSAYFAELRELQKAGDEGALAEARKADPAEKFLPRFVDASKRYAGLDEALPFLRWIVENAPTSRTGDEIMLSEEAQSALDTILRDQIASKELGSFAAWLSWRGDRLGNERCRRALDRIIRDSPIASVQMVGLLSRAELTVRDDDATDSQRTAAAEDLNRVIVESESEGTVTRARSALFELEKLQLGLVAPDIEGKDLEGVAFKLSDYRGKVVVIDFWGDW